MSTIDKSGRLQKEVLHKLLQTEKISNNITSIAVSNLVPSTYFLQVIHNNQEVTTFKLIKN
jgi:hypothetical protein